jgi:NADPH-dependent ferric siderophore reductase
VVAQVVETTRLAPHLVRVRLGGPGLALLDEPVHADSYVKLVFAPPGPRPIGDDGRVDLDALTAALPPGAELRRRTYTVRAWSPGSGGVDAELVVDVVVHGDAGVAGPWAAHARPGDEVLVAGPGGAWSPDPTADAHLLVGDASALPAIAVALERLPAHARGVAVIEVPGPDDELALAAPTGPEAPSSQDEQPIPAPTGVHVPGPDDGPSLSVPAGIEVVWVHVGAAPGDALVDAVRAWPWPDGRIGVFVHGEAGAVRRLRSYLRIERGVPRADLSVSGYWRLGADDEGWRAGKRAWLAGIEADEATAGAA